MFKEGREEQKKKTSSITALKKLKGNIIDLEEKTESLYKTLANTLEENTSLKLEIEKLKKQIHLSDAVELAFKTNFEIVSSHRKHGIYVLATNTVDLMRWYIEKREGEQL